MTDIKPKIYPLGAPSQLDVNNAPDPLRGRDRKRIVKRNKVDLHILKFRILQRLPKIRSDESMTAINLAHINVDRTLLESKPARFPFRKHP